MSKIEIELSDKLISKIHKLSHKFKCSISDIIEESLLEYYNISLLDLQNEPEKYYTNFEETIDLEIYKKDKIVDVLKSSKTLDEASKKLNLSRRTLQRYIRKFSINWKSLKNEYIK